jgi:hypothetical protein
MVLFELNPAWMTPDRKLPLTIVNTRFYGAGFGFESSSIFWSASYFVFTYLKDDGEFTSLVSSSI